MAKKKKKKKFDGVHTVTTIEPIGSRRETRYSDASYGQRSATQREALQAGSKAVRVLAGDPSPIVEEVVKTAVKAISGGNRRAIES